MIFQRWKEIRQLPSAPPLSLEEDLSLQLLFYTGARAGLIEIKDAWPLPDDKHSLARILITIKKLETEIDAFIDDAERKLKELKHKGDSK